MSSHFNYEIDEINLRSKLREMNYPYKEEAWHSFEAFSDSCKTHIKTRTLPQINLTINRNLLVPVFFGAGILLLSIFLYKFISNNITVDEKASLGQFPPPPKTEEKITPVAADTVKQQAENAEMVRPDTSVVNSPGISIPTPSAPAVNNSVAVITQTPEPVKTNTVAAVPVTSAAATSGPSWFCFTNTDVYESPNLVSKKIGKVNNGQSFSALEETNYYIKVVFDQSGNTGYVLKIALRKSGQGSAPRRKENKAEEMETKTVTNLLPSGGNSEEKEPELK